MIRVLIDNWWLLAMRGIFALAFALFAFSLESTVGTGLLSAIARAGTVVVFGLLALAAGICTIFAALRGAKRHERWPLLLLDGLIVCIAGVVILVAPELDLIWLARIVAALAIVAGILELLVARRLRRHVHDEWFLALAGIASVGFGLYLVLAWNREAVTILRWLVAYAAFSAIAILALGFRLRGLLGSVRALAGHEVSTS